MRDAAPSPSPIFDHLSVSGFFLAPKWRWVSFRFSFKSNPPNKGYLLQRTAPRVFGSKVRGLRHVAECSVIGPGPQRAGGSHHLEPCCLCGAGLRAECLVWGVWGWVDGGVRIDAWILEDQAWTASGRALFPRIMEGDRFRKTLVLF